MVEGDVGVPLSYGAIVVSSTSDLTISATGTGPTDGMLTVTPSNDLVGVFDTEVGVWATSSGGSTYDAQHVAVFISPAAPASLSIATAGVAWRHYGHQQRTDLRRQRVVSGLTVAIYADGGSTPIGTAVASGTTVDVTTTVPLADGSHTFTVEQFVSYSDTTVGNRTVPAGSLYSVASASTVSSPVDARRRPRPT